jgi:hypothetical protein
VQWKQSVTCSWPEEGEERGKLLASPMRSELFSLMLTGRGRFDEGSRSGY